MLFSVQSVLVWILVVGLCGALKDDSATKAPSSYKWKAGKWGSCHSQMKCGEGQQQRSVWCAHLDDRTSLKVLCDPNSMPAEVRSCFQVCDEHRGRLSWRVGDWGPCLPIGQETHRVSGAVQVTFHSTSRYLKGSMLRDVVCVYRRSNHSQARMVNDEACKHFETKPNGSLPCTVPRSQDCIVTEFGHWLECKGCGTSNRTRLRKVLVANRHGGRPCPKLSETEPCNEAVACLQSPHRIREYRLRIGAWSECFSLEHNHEDVQFGFWASVGSQTREVTCKDENGVPSDLRLCLGEDDPHVPAQVQACVVPSDCLVSSWSEWSIIKEGCLTQSGDAYPELRRRTRQVLRVPLGPGEPCPHLEEIHEMSDKGKLPPCTKYKWEPTEWSDCILTDQMNIRKVLCGGGIRRRNLTCLRSDDLVPVSPSFCLEPPPPVVHRCSIQCRQDCVVSAWSAWGPCKPNNCKNPYNVKKTGYQVRSRTILVEPVAEGGEDCPPLHQVDLCDHPSCHHWRTTEFGTCVVLNKELKCGQGKQSRSLYCVNLEGEVVLNSFCQINLPTLETSVPCYIPCPNDCVLSPWSNWSPCSHICSNVKEHGVRSRNRTILALSGHGGTPCPKQNELAETEVCNTHSCLGFGWKALPWQACKVLHPSEPCGFGKQSRDVWCLEEKRRASDSKCNPLPRPPDTRNCTVPCPKDCSLSKFSDWTECKDACSSVDSGETIPTYQERVKHVLQWPEAGRLPCPTMLKEVRACPSRCTEGENCLFPCHTYSWAVQDWGSCVLPDNKDCGAGYRTRGVTCMRNNEEEVEISFCLRLNHTIPSASQPCHVECEHPCVFSEWSDWSSCPLMCGGIQIRSRTLLSDSQQIKECKDEYHYPLNETKSCPCNVHSALAEGDWSDCILYDMDEATPINGVKVNGRCGVGRRLRRVACYDKNNELANPFHCTTTGYEEDACMVTCAVDCAMSPWSDWSPCSAVCGPGMQYRTRKITQPAYEGGRPCPTADAAGVNREVRLCSAPCEQYQWKVIGSWTRCELTSNEQCGTGRRSRTIRCKKSDRLNNEVVVREEFCDPVLKPADTDYCPVPCPMDCVVSDWSEWSECPKPCNSSHIRKRTRRLERKSPESVRPCPLLEEQVLCTLNENCFHYAWNLTEWTSCIIPDGATCGEGTKQRGVICQRSDSRSVENKFCLKTGTVRPNSEEVACRVDCPIDCEVSHWSEWNSDDCKPCGSSSGVVVRRRHVTVNPSSTGRPCPTQMMQRKPCPAQPCYFWYNSSWSECELEGGQCGHGHRRRFVVCKRKDDTVVERKYCMEMNTSHIFNSLVSSKWLDKLLDIHEEEPCFTPCPGDCHVSEWSEWSPCHRDCGNGEQVGVQTRSRAIEIQPSPYGESCPRQLWETKPCFGGPCLSFSWQVRQNNVQCVRSDGLIVIGGCHGKPRPCVPVCRVPHSECGHSGECMCETGYRSLYREGLILDEPRELVGCELINLTNSSHHTGPMAGESEVRVVYFPNDNEVSFWMYAMIAVGSAFIIFVAVTIYLMCHSTVRRGGSPLRRHSLTIRRNTSKDVVGGIKP